MRGVKLLFAYAHSNLFDPAKLAGVVASSLVSLLGLGAVAVPIILFLRPSIRLHRFLAACLALMCVQAIRALFWRVLPRPSTDFTTPLTTSDNVLVLLNVLTVVIAYLLYRVFRDWLARAPQLGTPNQPQGAA